MRDFLVDLVNHKFVITLSVVLLVSSAILLFQDGVSTVDVIILIAIAAACFVVWRLLVSRNTVGIGTIQQFQTALRNGEHATLVEFFSPYCAGCLAMKPIVDQLEAEAGERLKVIRLNIDTEPGRTLVDTYSVLFTPTFVYFDPNGNKVRDSVLVLDRARIMYDLDKLRTIPLNSGPSAPGSNTLR